jgi:hypothetical protein
VRGSMLREINSPLALATLGAFFVPEPIGTCLVIAAGIWWLYRKPDQTVGSIFLLQALDWRIDFYRFRVGQNAPVVLLPSDRAQTQANRGMYFPDWAARRGPNRSIAVDYGYSDLTILDHGGFVLSKSSSPH